MNEARIAGWWLKKASAAAKVWGVITCGDPDLPRSSRCALSVLSTSGSRDGSETAKVVQRAVAVCPHRFGAPVAPTADILAAEQSVERAEFCVDAAEALSEADAHRDLVEDFLAGADLAAADAEGLLTAALEQDAAADQATERAAAAAAAASVDVRLGSAELTSQAEAHAAHAETLAHGDDTDVARAVVNRAAAVRGRVAALRASR